MATLRLRSAITGRDRSCCSRQVLIRLVVCGLPRSVLSCFHNFHAAAMKTSPALSRAQKALHGVPGPEEDAVRGGFNPLQCPGGAVRVLSELLAMSQPPPALPPVPPQLGVRIPGS